MAWWFHFCTLKSACKKSDDLAGMTTGEAKWRGHMEKLHGGRGSGTARMRINNPADEEKQAAAV